MMTNSEKSWEQSFWVCVCHAHLSWAPFTVHQSMSPSYLLLISSRVSRLFMFFFQVFNMILPTLSSGLGGERTRRRCVMHSSTSYFLFCATQLNSIWIISLDRYLISLLISCLLVAENVLSFAQWSCWSLLTCQHWSVSKREKEWVCAHVCVCCLWET